MTQPDTIRRWAADLMTRTEQAIRLANNPETLAAQVRGKAAFVKYWKDLTAREASGVRLCIAGQDRNLREYADVVRHGIEPFWQAMEEVHASRMELVNLCGAAARTTAAAADALDEKIRDFEQAMRDERAKTAILEARLEDR